MGKTTTAVNLAAALAAQNKRVLLIDLDGQASASLSLGFDRARLSPSSADVLLRSVPVQDAIRPTAVEHLELITASTDLGQFDTALAARSQKEQRLKQVLDPLRSRYDMILLDCAPWQSLLGIASLVAADRFIVPVVPQFLAMEGVANLLHAAERLRETQGARVQLLGLLLSMVDYRLRLTRQAVDALRGRYGSGVFGIEIRVNVRLAEAPEFGHTIFQHDPASTGAKLFELLAEELLLRCGLPSHAVDEMPAFR